MVAKRATVAKRLLDKDTAADRDTDDILDYFDLMGYLIDRKALDKETAWMMFSDAAFAYWFAARTYIEANGTGEPYWGISSRSSTRSSFQLRAARASYPRRKCNGEPLITPPSMTFSLFIA